MNRLTKVSDKGGLSFTFDLDITCNKNEILKIVELGNRLKMYEDSNEPIPIEEWHEDYGDCLFWKFPIEEPPYCGSPLNSEWENNYNDYYTHFTRLVIPQLN